MPRAEFTVPGSYSTDAQSAVYSSSTLETEDVAATTIHLLDQFRRGEHIARPQSLLRLAEDVAREVEQAPEPDLDAWAEMMAEDVADAND